MEPPETLTVTRGELVDRTGRGAHTLIWLWPLPRPNAPKHPQVVLDPDRLAAVTLRPGESLVLRRASVDEPVLTEAPGGWEILVPSGDLYCDVSRAPTRFSLLDKGELVVETEAAGTSRLWIDLAPLDGPVRAIVAPWSAVAVGAAVLWHVPQDEKAAWQRVAPVAAEARKGLSTPGFRFYSLATMQVISQLHRRATRRMPVPRSATSERWEAGEPFILAGEPGCGKTTLAKAVYSVVGAPRFAAVHPVAVEQEIDLVALTGCRDFAHDGRKVPDQQGHLDVVVDAAGVVLIDEVHTLNERLKQHLTDILTEWTFRPRGDSMARKKIRGLMVFATNRPDVLRDPARFPHDLFARMGGEAGIVEVPPLRWRRWELPWLAAAVLDECAPRLAFAPDAVRKLLLHHWPLNHWELDHTVREAHSVAASQGLTEIPARLLTLKGPPAAAADEADEVAIPLRAKVWRFPPTVGWRELFQGLRHFKTFTALRDAWQQQLGAQNAAAVNRRVGRLIRCDHCDPRTCPRCFSGALAQTEPAVLLSEMERLADASTGDASAWIAAALAELVVERVEGFRTDRTRAALEAVRAAPSRERLIELLGALRGR
ncbi:MAG: sigma 54-interacting transcriptional regulator [Deltaproteobacteria bacterium]|nr:sigma 54-interacting transcriptional regulator [Deltaproteobacteria bacterium]